MAMATSVTVRMTAGPARSRVIGPGRTAYWLSVALTVTVAAGSLLTFTVPAVLRGTAVMNGSARGTALVVLLAGVPALACSMLLAARGSAAAVITWLGSAGFLLYNSLMFAFATPANRLFPLYLAMLALSAWTIGTLLGQADVAAVYGGAGLIRDGFGMPDSWLAGTPLTGWVLPGVALLIGVAVPQLAAAALIVTGARPGLAAGFLAGLLLVAWIAVQLLILRRYFFLQPVIAGIGAAEVLLAWRWWRAAGGGRPGRIVTGSRDQRL